ATLLENYSYISLTGLLICHYLSGLCYALFFFIIAHQFSLLFTLSTTLLYIFFIRLKQNHQFCSVMLARDKFSASWYEKDIGRGQFHRTLTFFFAINQMYGSLFLVCLLVLCPTNTAMTMWLTHGYVEVENRFYIVFCVVYELM